MSGTILAWRKTFLFELLVVGLLGGVGGTILAWGRFVFFEFVALGASMSGTISFVG